MLAIILIVVIVIVILTGWGFCLSMDGNAWGILVSFLGLNLIGLIISLIIYDNSLKYKDVNVVQNYSLPKSNQDNFDKNEEVCIQIHNKVWEYLNNLQFDGAKLNIEVLKNLNAKKHLNEISEDIKDFMEKTNDEKILLDYSKLIKFINE